MKKFDKTLENLTERFSPGLFNALCQPLRLKRICNKCGFMMPKYKGRYPNFCPMCADPVTDKDKEVPVDEVEEPIAAARERNAKEQISEARLVGKTVTIEVPAKVAGMDKWLKQYKLKDGDQVKVLKFVGYQGEEEEYEVTSLDGKSKVILTTDLLKESDNITEAHLVGKIVTIKLPAYGEPKGEKYLTGLGLTVGDKVTVTKEVGKIGEDEVYEIKKANGTLIKIRDSFLAEAARHLDETRRDFLTVAEVERNFQTILAMLGLTTVWKTGMAPEYLEMKMPEVIDLTVRTYTIGISTRNREDLIDDGYDLLVQIADEHNLWRDGGSLTTAV